MKYVAVGYRVEEDGGLMSIRPHLEVTPPKVSYAGAQADADLAAEKRPDLLWGVEERES